MELGKLIPQIFFDILARFVPGALLFGSWIVLLGQNEWSRLLDALLGGHLSSDNAVAAMSLVLFFLSFLTGYVLSPFAKLVQRINERVWVGEDKDDVGRMYDGLRAHKQEAGALCAKIRAEFTMHNALSVTFFAVTFMTIPAHWPWVFASLSISVLMAWRGGTTEITYRQTTKKFFEAYDMQLPARKPVAEAERSPKSVDPSEVGAE